MIFKGSFFDNRGSWTFEQGYKYGYHVFVSYTRINESAAQSIAEELVAKGLIVFFAPITFRAERLREDQDHTFWSDLLQDELIRSIHFVGILSNEYLIRPWAGGLELNGFINIRKVNPNRKIALMPIDIQRQFIPEPLGSFLVTRSKIIQWTVEASKSTDLKIRDRVAPDRCFPKLPITTGDWSDGTNRYDPDPPYEAYERCVREVMVLISCGMDPNKIPQRFSRGTRWDKSHLEDVVKTALDLIHQKITPF